MFSYPFECRKGEKLYAHLLYSYNGRTHLSTSRVRVNEIVSTFIDEKNDCPDMVKTIKQGQIFVITSFFFLWEMPVIMKTICKSFRSLCMQAKPLPDCDASSVKSIYPNDY